MAKDPREQALQLELKKRYVEAAELWETAGQIEKAIANYHRGGKTNKAIELALRHDMKKRAADLYTKIELHERAAELYRQERDFGAAGRSLRQAGKIADAALMLERGEEWGEAARLYESVGDLKRAGELYEKAGDVEAAGRVYEVAIDQQEVDRLGGKKDLARVAHVLTRVKSFEKAADMFVRADEVGEAVVVFVRMGEVDLAARLLRSTSGDVGNEVLAQIDPREPAAVEFARMFHLARDHPRSGRVFELAGKVDKAAALFEKSGDYYHAALMYEKIGETLRAAWMYEKAGNFTDAAERYRQGGDEQRAASCLEQAGEWADAGMLALEAGKHAKALELLQKLPEDHPRWTEASTKVARLLAEKGHPELAIERLRRVITTRPLGDETVECHYDLARLLAGHGGTEEARSLFAAIVGFRFNYRDAAKLLEELKGRTVPLPSDPAAPAAAAAANAPVSAVPAPVVTRMAGIEVLSEMPLFADLSADEMRRFWEASELRTVPAGAVLIEEGVQGPGLFVIRRGTANVVIGDDVLVQLHRGEFFGEISLIDHGAPTSARVVAATPMEILFLHRGAFNQILAASDSTALKIYRIFVGTLCERLRRTSRDLASARGH